MRNLDPLNNFKYFNRNKPEGYVVFLTSETETKGMTIEVASPEDRVFELEYKPNTIILTDNNNKITTYVNDVDTSSDEIEKHINKLIEEDLEDE
ncbi:hypothetical protein PALS1_167 [Staphylococcus phage PALS_1]|nr:hypothetical protein PALS1_167 [Staphylococcus phage PALS_1]UXR08309.1 hypothetical protein [Staphylococcus phage vB_ScaM-V1SC04]